MHYYNGINAAKRIGISYKTLLRYIEKDKIRPEEGKTPTGQLVISEDQVEAARLEVQRERDMLRQTRTVLADGQIETDIDMERRLASLAQSIANLNATVASQTRRIGELAIRVAQLEAQASLHIPTQPVPSSTTSAIPPKPKPQKRTTEPSPDLPDGAIGLADFAAQHGVHRSTALRHCISGIQGDFIEVTERPKSGGRIGDKERWLNPEQQRAAIAFWQKWKVTFQQCENVVCVCH